jgi:hypothetical protein
LRAFAEIGALKNPRATPISNPIGSTTLAALALGGKRPGASLIIEGRSGLEPGKPGRRANRGTGSEDIVGIQETTDDFRGMAIGMSGHASLLSQVP